MWNIVLVGLAAIVLTGCTIKPPGSGEVSVIPEAPESLEEKIAKQRFEVIEEIDSVPFAGTVDSWGYFDKQAIWVESSPSRYYMLTFQFPCHDLAFTEIIAIKTRLPQIYKGDKVIIPDRTATDCFIDRIYQLERITRRDENDKNSDEPEEKEP